MDIDPNGPRPRRRVHRRAWQAARAAEISQIIDDLVAGVDIAAAYAEQEEAEPEPEPEPQVIEVPHIPLRNEPRPWTSELDERGTQA
jgi:hypothetical protein